MVFVARPLFRRKPARRIKAQLASPDALLKEIRRYEIAPAYYLHQCYAPSIAKLAAHGYLPDGYVLGAEGFLHVLAKHTRWQVPCSFIQRALQKPVLYAEAPARQYHTFDHGFAWRLFVVRCYPGVWQRPPTLSEFKCDTETVQQAAIYHRDVAKPVLQRISEKYDEGLWIIGEHYLSWPRLLPTRANKWGSLLEDSIEGDGLELGLAIKHAKYVDMVCEHVLHEIRVHEARLKAKGLEGGLRGRRGDALLAKVVEECWHQWKWADGSDPLKEFKSFFRFAMGVIDAISPPGFRETSGTEKTMKRYLRLFIENDHGLGRVSWNEAETLPGAKRSELVDGHGCGVYPPMRRYWWPRSKVYLKAYMNLVRGYPPTIDNHDRI